MFRGLLFEADAEQFRIAGIRIGADHREHDQALLDNALAPFPLGMRLESLTMSHVYTLLYCFENSVRDLVKERLHEKHGVDWWVRGVPEKVRKFAEGRQSSAVEESWLEGEKSELLGFLEFGHLADTVMGQWDLFDDLIPSQHWLKQRMDELEKARNFIAHNRLLLPSERQRIEMYIADWNRTVGV